MNWAFWVLLVLSLAVVLLPFTGLLTPEASFTLWFFGSVLLLALILWVTAVIAPILHRRTSESG